MIKLVHARSGGEMWVHESRLEEYLAAGHKLAAPPTKKTKGIKKEPENQKG